MTQTRIVVELTAESDDSDEFLARLTRELELDLRDIGTVEYLHAPVQEQAKGAGEVVAGALALLTATEPAYLEAVVQTVVAFLRRNEGRRAQLKVGDIELAIDQPSENEVAALIEMTRSAVERAMIDRADR